MKQFKTKENKIHKINCIFLSRRKRIMYNHKRAQNIYMYYIYICALHNCANITLFVRLFYTNVSFNGIYYIRKENTQIYIHTYVYFLFMYLYIKFINISLIFFYSQFVIQIISINFMSFLSNNHTLYRTYVSK